MCSMEESRDADNYEPRLTTALTSKWEGEDEDNDVKESWEDDEEKSTPAPAKNKELIDKIAEKEAHRRREVERRLDNQEAITIKNTLMLFGVPESPGENTKAVVMTKFKKRLELTLETSAVHSSFRLGKLKPDGARRAIVIYFNSPEARSAVWSSRTKLRGSGLMLIEALTRKRQEVYEKVRKLFKVGRRWTEDGVIHVQLRDGTRRQIYTLEDLQEAIKLNSSA